MKEKKMTLNESLEKIEHLLADLEKSDTDLEESVVKYEEGLKLIKDMEARLTAVKNKVHKIRKQFSEAPEEDDNASL